MAKARALIEGASHDPDTLRTLYWVFDDAWGATPLAATMHRAIFPARIGSRP